MPLPPASLSSLWLHALLACTPAPSEPSSAPVVRGLPACAKVGEGLAGGIPLGWIDGSRAERALWRVSGGLHGDAGPVDADDAWILGDSVWLARGSQLVPVGPDGEAAPVDLSATPVQVVGDAASPWVVLGGEEPPDPLVQLRPDADGWVTAVKAPRDGGVQRFAQLVVGERQLAARRVEGDVWVLNPRGVLLRSVALDEGMAVGLLGQGVFAVGADGSVVLDLPGRRHREALGPLRDLRVSPEGLIAVTAEGTLVSRVREGVGLRPGIGVDEVVQGVDLHDGRAVAVALDADGHRIVVAGPLRPEVQGPSWAPRVTPPARCRLDLAGELLLPPLAGEGRVRLMIAPPPSEDQTAPAPVWMDFALP